MSFIGDLFFVLFFLKIFLPLCTILKLCSAPPYQSHIASQNDLSVLEKSREFFCCSAGSAEMKWGVVQVLQSFFFHLNVFLLHILPQWLTLKRLTAQRIVPLFPSLALSRLLPDPPPARLPSGK